MQRLTGEVVAHPDIGKYRLLRIVPRRCLPRPHSAGRTKPCRSRWPTISRALSWGEQDTVSRVISGSRGDS